MKALKTFLPFLLLALAANAYGHRDGQEVHEFGWMIVDHDSQSMSSMKDLDHLEGLQRKFGDEFIYIRDGEDRYVIRDRALLKRALEAQRPVRESGRRVGRAARAQAIDALSGWDADADQARLARKIEKLSRKIDRAEARGESAEEIQREREELKRVVENKSDDRETSEHAVPKEHEARRRDADQDLDRAIKNLKRELREILREAKSRHLAERVE